MSNLTISARCLPCRPIYDELQAEGWRTPDTYCKLFAPVANRPAVYLFMLVDRDTFDSGLVAYVGMSRQLAKRWADHSILRQIDFPEYWTMRWFKPVQPERLRAVEAKYISRFDPPWNIIGRRRGLGVALHG